MARIAFDLDETLATPILDARGAIEGFAWRLGTLDLLDEIGRHHTLILWSVGGRAYVDRALSEGLSAYFDESYSWDDKPHFFKDVRDIDVRWLVDDAEEYAEQARALGIAERYITVPAIGSAEDARDPLAWARLIRDTIARGE